MNLRAIWLFQSGDVAAVPRSDSLPSEPGRSRIGLGKPITRPRRPGSLFAVLGALIAVPVGILIWRIRAEAGPRVVTLRYFREETRSNRYLGRPTPPIGPVRRVALIDTSQVQNGVELGLRSLEDREDRLVLIGQVRLEYTAARGSHRTCPRMEIHAVDDLGGRYSTPGTGFRGYFRGNEEEWQIWGHLKPALNPEASELRITIPRIRWRHVPNLADESVTYGPWVFQVPLDRDVWSSPESPA